ncbi:hypothetical protein KMZ32_02525 [Phycicoccus sp. MAQZ13P-2]|uniref:hypothetical protein n=1 Tax=Phycicoccus mangrovi TaxID=2840470 RepID=UPI001C003895|nr:hypothetical protein [Phycicoccus mangrovi]MBT9254848.1 hypothetical protein [Phycicoccus mangrovi]MBT9272947.1 hypothetical protein [Phycicoccus mangrovi]
MTTYRVDARTVLQVGEQLVGLAEALTLMGDPAADRWAFGPGRSGAAAEELLGAWRHARLRVADALTVLGEAAGSAGGAYLDTEAGVSRRLGGGPTW